MYKKRTAMKASAKPEELNENGDPVAVESAANDENEVIQTTTGENDDPLAGVADTTEDGPTKRKRGRPSVKSETNEGEATGNGEAKPKVKAKNSYKVLKITRKKLKKSIASTQPGPGPDEDGEYQVDAIVDHKKEKGKTVYRVRWRGYAPNEDSWLLASDLSCKDMLKRYKKKIEKETKDVFNVDKIIDHRRLHGTIYYRVRWQNYGPRDDTWQAKEMLNCNELLKEYHDDLNDKILKREQEKLKFKVNTNEYEVESIVDKKVSKKGKAKYLIHWKGWESSDDTWEPEESLNCHELIKAFNSKKKTPMKKKPKAKKSKKSYNSDSDEDDSDDSDYGTSKKGHVSKGEYEVEKVLNGRLNKLGKWDFYVMWKGWGPEHNTWEPEAHLHCPKLIDQYLGKNKVPRTILAKLEKQSEEISSPKQKRKPPTERTAAGGLRGRTKGEMKVLSFSK